MVPRHLKEAVLVWMLVNNVEVFKTAWRKTGWREARLEDAPDTNVKPKTPTLN